MHELFHYCWGFWWWSWVLLSYFTFHVKLSQHLLILLQCECHILLFCPSLKALFFFCRLQMYVSFFFNRLFSASQSKCHFVSTLEENVANRELKCYFYYYSISIYYSMDSDFFNITCKSKKKVLLRKCVCFIIAYFKLDWNWEQKCLAKNINYTY